MGRGRRPNGLGDQALRRIRFPTVEDRFDSARDAVEVQIAQIAEDDDRSPALRGANDLTLEAGLETGMPIAPRSVRVFAHAPAVRGIAVVPLEGERAQGIG